ncbi:LysR family transcriptional regulator [Microvirga pudoricolor]|uniref:LysR family transcriptional regulator n=1 Tax=Microvirga pudoricolor TaxID=2778729 RepID=UPI001950E4C8|nr:LysR family transcriptional regulator [Microvirga pudoricolor]MBM6592640.1 LysR family transcriptional regulator [Microvirga pudoricolor]
MAHPPLSALSAPSWDDLQIFLAVVAHGSLNGAAKALGQSQPTVARRVKALEAALGVELFRRGPNSLELTEAGKAVRRAASPMGPAAAAAAQAAAVHRPDPDAPVRITTTTSVALFLALHAGRLAQAAHPSEIAYLTTRRQLDLANGEADIALRTYQLVGADHLVARRVGAIAFAVYSRDPEPTAFIGPSEDPALSRQAAYVQRIAEGRPIVARIGDTPIRHHAARSGLGAAFLPCWLGDSDPDLVRITEPEGDLVEDVFLVMHERARRRPAVKRVVGALAELFKRERAVLTGIRTG